ncbi:hypothetical protein ACCS56_25625 [Rhizobium ruizarguesonis]
MDWEVEFLKHLRTNHLALAGALVALLVAMTLAQSAAFRRAYDEFLVLNTVITKYLSLDNMHKVADAGAIEFFATPASYEVTYRADQWANDIINTLAIKDPKLGTLRIGSWQWGTAIATKGPRSRLQFFSNDPTIFGANNLNQFAKIWDFLGKAHAGQIKSLSFSGMRAFGSRGELANLPPEIVQDKSLQPDNYVDATFDLVEEADTVLTFAQRKWYIDVELKPNGTNVDLNSLYLPIDVVYIPQMTSQNIVVPFTDAGVPIGDFANAFGDLQDAAKGLESLALTDLGPYLRQKVDDTTDQITIFGVEVPISSIGTWGLILVFVFQFYFITDLTRYMKVGSVPEVAATFPWIGVYPGILSRIAFFFSTSVLPIIDGLFALFKSEAFHTFTLQSTLVSVSALAVIAMSIYSGRQVLAFQESLVRQPETAVAKPTTTEPKSRRRKPASSAK